VIRSKAVETKATDAKAVETKAAAPKGAARPGAAHAQPKPAPSVKASKKQTGGSPTSTPAAIEKAKSAAMVASAAQAAPASKGAGGQATPASAPATKPLEKIVDTVTQKKVQPVAASPSPGRAAPAAVAARAVPAAPEKTMAAARTGAVKPAAPAVAKAEPKTAAKPSHRAGFKPNEFIVYPAHGVGQIIAVEEQEVAGFRLELFVINFVKDKMTLKVPLPKVLSGAIRKLSDLDTMKKALDTLTGRARIKRTMWSRRAQEYEAKINSGDIGAIAEVVRDLYRSDAQPEQSYSERQLYEAALDRMSREISAVHRITETESLKLIEIHLQKGPRRGAKTDAPEEGGADLEGDNIERAA
jgi:CarD family transcriptional regulator